MPVKREHAKLPRTRSAFAKALSDAACAGYCAGFRDRRNGEDIPKPDERRIRVQIRAELQRWLGAI